MTDRPIFLLIDGHAVIYRAFYALPKLSDNQGRVVNAVYGFARVILSAIKDFTPTYLAVTFDHPEPTFRHKEFKDYKAHRPEMPDQLKPQIPIIKELVAALNIPQFEKKGFEADDLIGTISYKLDYEPESINADPNLLTMIVTGDKDSFQLVDDNTHVWVAGRGRRKDKEYDPQAVKEKMKVRPDQIADYKGLMGDSSDNIPGIKGVGKKTAAKLLNHYQSVEEIYQQVDKIEAGQAEPGPVIKGSLLNKLKQGREVAFLSKRLATINCDVPLKINLKKCQVESYDKAEAVKLFTKLGFKSLISELPDDQFEAEVQEALF